MTDKRHIKTPGSTEGQTEESSYKKIPLRKAPKGTKTGSSGSTQLTLEEEAKKYTAKKKPLSKPKPMTSRIYLAGQAMSALLSRSQGLARREDIKREAYDIADFMLSDD